MTWCSVVKANFLFNQINGFLIKAFGDFAGVQIGFFGLFFPASVGILGVTVLIDVVDKIPPFLFVLRLIPSAYFSDVLIGFDPTMKRSVIITGGGFNVRIFVGALLIIFINGLLAFGSVFKITTFYIGGALSRVAGSTLTVNGQVTNFVKNILWFDFGLVADEIEDGF